MENDKECEQLLKNIINELNKTRDNSIEISNKLNIQSENINNIKDNLDEISYQTDVSRWQLNYIESTFGKIYRKIHNYPIKENMNNMSKLMNIKSRLLGLNLFSKKKEDIRKKIKEDTMFDEVDNIINEIKEINKINSNEIDKQNLILDYNIEITDNSQHRIIRNTKKINKLLD